MSDALDRLTAALADRYRVERQLGQGGMATVYLAEDLKHKRKVALKVLKPELAAVLGADRFVQEITTTAALQHPHILPLFDSGTADGFLYYVMPFIDGETLRSKLDRETQLGIDEAVSITTAVADALDYAHRQGVIHRDIKPENILLHEGRPMVADFGIALALSAAAGGRMTETGMSLGTPHYMSPEQATAEKELSPRSDIYSLGSVLYEMLTGDPPHVASSAQQIIMKIVTEEAAPVTRLRKAVPPNVAAAVAKSLEKLPADRFESAAKFGEALTNPAFSAATGPTAASPTAQRPNRLPLAATVLVVASLALAAWGWLRPAPADHQVQLARQLTFEGTVEAAAISPDGRWLAYITRDCPPEPCTSALRVREIDGTQSVRLLAWDRLDFDLRWSPDGQRVLFGGERNGAPGTYLIDRLGGSAQRLPGLGRTMDFSRDGRPILAVEHEARTWLVRYDATSLAPVDSVAAPAGFTITGLSVEPTGARVAITTVAGERRLIALLGPDGRLLDSAAAAPRYPVRWAAAGDALLVFVESPGISDNLFRIPLSGDRLTWDRRQLILGQVQTGYLGRFDASRGGRLAIVSAPTTHSLLVSHLDAARPVWTSATSRTGYMSWMAMSPDGSRFAAATTDNLGDNIYLFPVDGGTPVPATAQRGIRGMPRWSPDGRRLVFTVGGQGFAIVDADGGPERPILPGRDSPYEVHWLADDSLVLIGGNTLAILDTLGRTQRSITLPDSLGGIFRPLLDPHTRQLAYWSERGTAVIVTDLRAGTSRSWGQANGGVVSPAGWIADGSLLVSSPSAISRLAGPGAPLVPVAPLEPGCSRVSVDRAGRVAVCGGATRKADVWLADQAGKSGWSE